MTWSGAEASPPVFVVGPRHHPRGRHLQHALGELGLDWTATDGVDARGWPPGRVGQVLDQRVAQVLHRRTLTPAEVGCALSHRRAVQAARRQAGEWALILEDDADPLPGFLAAVRQVATWRLPRPTAVLLYRDPAAVALPWPVRGVGAGWRAAVHPPHGAVAYLLNRAARSSYPTSGPLTGVADWPYPWASRTQFLLPRRSSVRTGTEPSLIGGPRRQAWRQLDESLVRRTARLLATATGLRYLRYRSVYGRWDDYVDHEIMRLLGAAGSRLRSALRSPGARAVPVPPPRRSTPAPAPGYRAGTG